MSGKAAKTVRKVDRRVKRTRDLLGDALVTLMQEKPWSEITVQQVLDRAQVSRSTFYAHYRDKNDLFMSDAEEFFESMAGLLVKQRERSQRVAPVREFLAHVTDARDFVAALEDAGKVQDIWELGRGHFARAIALRLAELIPKNTMTTAQLTATSFMFAGALISLTTWWMHRGMRESPEEMDRLYHQMVWPGADADATTAYPAMKMSLPFPRKLETRIKSRASEHSPRHA